MRLPFFQTLTKKVGIDLGTSRVRIWTDQEGFVVDEPSYIAIDSAIQKVVAVGQEAQDMLGKVSGNITVFQPIINASVSDPDVVIAMLRFFLQKVFHTPFFFRPTFLVSTQSFLTDPEKEALSDIFFTLGAKEVLFIDQILSAAIGSGVPIADASGSFFLHLGAGKVEAGIVSLGSLVSVHSSSYGGDYIDRSIQHVVKQQEMLNIGVKVAEKIKKNVMMIVTKNVELIPGKLRVTGQDTLEGVPKEVVISTEAFDSLTHLIGQKYVELSKQLFEAIPAELTTDIIDKGMLLSGGVAQLRGLDSYLLSSLGIPVSVVDEPERAVIKGMAQVLHNLELFKESIGYRLNQQRRS